MTQPLNERILRIDDVVELTGISRSMIYKLQSASDFPSSIQLSERAVGWRRADVVQWLERKRRTQTLPQGLPTIYMAGRMGTAVDNKEPGREFSCWRLFDVAGSSKTGDLETENSPNDVLIADRVVRTFHGTNVSFLYSGPWKARGSYHGYIHGVTTCNPDAAEGAAYRGSLQGITRADVVVAFLDDLEAYGTLVEIGFARASNKRIIVITPDEEGDWGRSKLASDLWFAIHAADKHVLLPKRTYLDEREKWLYAHLHVASIIAEWYPNAAVQL